MLKKLIIPITISLVLLSYASNDLLATNRHQLKAVNEKTSELELINRVGEQSKNDDESKSRRPSIFPSLTKLRNESSRPLWLSSKSA